MIYVYKIEYIIVVLLQLEPKYHRVLLVHLSLWGSERIERVKVEILKKRKI